jgi:sodium/potassium/calcium exchanger 6
MSILWIVAICEYMIDAISLIGLLFDLPVSFLGLTLLAWGNSAGDFVANPAITRLGMSQTAVTACFAGPLFNSLIGFGISLIVACWSKDVSFHILEHPQLIIASVSLVASNSVSVYVISNSAGNVRSAFGYLMIGVYLIFFCALLIYTLI